MTTLNTFIWERELHMTYDFIIIGGGIVGLSTGMAVMKEYPDKKVLLVEKENELAMHQTGRNSGVIHSGIYYTPGSLKARFAKEGTEKLINYCDEHNIQYDICGKLLMATSEKEIPLLENLYRRAFENGLEVSMIGKDEIKAIEPYSNGIQAIQVPATGIVD